MVAHAVKTTTAAIEPPEDAERAVYVSPDYVLPEVLARISARLKGN